MSQSRGAVSCHKVRNRTCRWLAVLLHRPWRSRLTPVVQIRASQPYDYVTTGVFWPVYFSAVVGLTVVTVAWWQRTVSCWCCWLLINIVSGRRNAIGCVRPSHFHCSFWTNRSSTLTFCMSVWDYGSGPLLAGTYRQWRSSVRSRVVVRVSKDGNAVSLTSIEGSLFFLVCFTQILTTQRIAGNLPQRHVTSPASASCRGAVSSASGMSLHIHHSSSHRACMRHCLLCIVLCLPCVARAFVHY